MRIATLIISLVLSLAILVQSCAVAAAGSISGSLSEDGSAEQKAAEDTSAGGGIGIFVGLLWIIGAGFVLAKPKASVWLFSVAAVLALIGGSTGFSDLFIWAGASALFAVGSWRGIAEKEKKDEQERAAYAANVAAVAQAAVAQVNSIAPPVSK
jgi:hypothetical protein